MCHLSLEVSSSAWLSRHPQLSFSWMERSNYWPRLRSLEFLDQCQPLLNKSLKSDVMNGLSLQLLDRRRVLRSHLQHVHR
jgi:hypothetical protein